MGKTCNEYDASFTRLVTRVNEKRSRTEDLHARLHKLYGALKTGPLTLVDLAPKIKDLRAHTQELERAATTIQSGGRP
jgi:biotin synthase-related radical SAM superfamily protein